MVETRLDPLLSANQGKWGLERKLSCPKWVQLSSKDNWQELEVDHMGLGWITLGIPPNRQIVCASQGVCPFPLSIEFIGINLIIIFHYCPFNVYRISNNSPFFIPDILNLYFLSYQLLRGKSWNFQLWLLIYLFIYLWIHGFIY